MNFIHVGDDSLHSFRLIKLVEAVGVILVTIRLQQAAPARLAVGRVPYFEIPVGRTEAVQALIFPVTATYLKRRAYHRTVNQSINHFAFLGRPIGRDRDVSQYTERDSADDSIGLDMVEHSGASVRDRHFRFSSFDVFDHAAIADRVTEFGCKCARQLIVAAFDL